MKRPTRNRRWIAPLVAGLLILLMPVVASSMTNSVTMPATMAHAIDVEVKADDLKPSQCATVLNIEHLQTGSGTFSADQPGKRSLILGSPGNDEITGGNLDDCLHGGTGTDTLDGGPGNDVCIGSATSTFDPSCETQITV